MSELRSAEEPAAESFEADEYLSEFRAAWTPGRGGPPAEEPFVAERRRDPRSSPSDAQPAEEHAEPWFVADVQEPAPKPEEPSPTKTDTWSGRAIGS